MAGLPLGLRLLPRSHFVPGGAGVGETIMAGAIFLSALVFGQLGLCFGVVDEVLPPAERFFFCRLGSVIEFGAMLKLLEPGSSWVNLDVALRLLHVGDDSESVFACCGCLRRCDG